MERGLYKYVAMVLAAIVGITGYFEIPWSGLSKSDWASWVQAVGSILAIVGAYYVARDQARRQSEQQSRTDNLAHLAEGELVEIVCRDARDAIAVATQYMVNFKNGPTFNFDLDRLTDVQLSIRSLYGRSVPSILLPRIVTIQRVLTYTIRAVQQRQGVSTSLSPESRTKASERLRLTDVKLTEIQNWVRAERKRLEVPPPTIPEPDKS
ncbi:hypothetical protein FOC29_28200 [Burkholderia vietnamiensis]|uniref:hypothetical protein n=1 Tax=Burkholderia vietnamiensis TaxID=60552 RepID=UPI001EE5D97C|nr:hypothetical protein [Burkholderia vietnamiensis]UKV75193.1 hypothetical protein FOC29_28200 [Burkholderia vietnamiensis]